MSWTRRDRELAQRQVETLRGSGASDLMRRALERIDQLETQLHEAVYAPLRPQTTTTGGPEVQLPPPRVDPFQGVLLARANPPGFRGVKRNHNIPTVSGRGDGSHCHRTFRELGCACGLCLFLVDLAVDRIHCDDGCNSRSGTITATSAGPLREGELVVQAASAAPPPQETRRVVINPHRQLIEAIAQTRTLAELGALRNAVIDLRGSGQSIASGELVSSYDTRRRQLLDAYPEQRRDLPRPISEDWVNQYQQQAIPRREPWVPERDPRPNPRYVASSPAQPPTPKIDEKVEELKNALEESDPHGADIAKRFSLLEMD